MVDRRLEIIDGRYSNRRKDSEDGWACAESYARKAHAFDRIVTTYAVSPMARVLELGCGAGNTTLHMAEKGFEAYGVDISVQGIEWAKDRAGEKSVSVHFSVCSVTDLQSFEDSFFDVVFDGDCLWMVIGPDRCACFSSIFRKLTPGGLFYAQAHVAKEGFRTRYEIAPGASFDPVTLISTIQNVPMYQYSTEGGFRKEIEEAGFELLRCGPLERNPLDSAAKNEAPFIAGSMFIEARKRIQKTANQGVHATRFPRA